MRSFGLFAQAQEYLNSLFEKSYNKIDPSSEVAKKKYSAFWDAICLLALLLLLFVFNRY